MNLIYRDIRKYKYQIVQDYSHQTRLLGFNIETTFISLDPSGLLTVRQGWMWDGASGPTIDTPDSMRGAMVHDALYCLMRMSLLPVDYRPYADTLFYEILLEDGMAQERARLWHETVRLLASGCAEPGTEIDRTYCAGKEQT